jgi:DNA polymerase-3 subunit gamma/tau
MVLKRKNGDLCTAYRPQTFSEMIGQTSIVKSIRQSLSIEGHAQCYLFSGESGCGKTTLARIVGMALNCTDLNSSGDPCCVCDSCKNIANKNHMDLNEINASSNNSINDIRRIEQEIKTRPMFGKVKMYILDEAHRLTTEAQNALLKDTEDMPKGVYIILCSTEPNKIIHTLRNRCESYNFKLLSAKEIEKLIETVGVFENYYPSRKELLALIEASERRPRNALRVLQQVINLRNDSPGVTEEDVLELIGSHSEEDKDIIDLCRLLTSKNHISWNLTISTYKKINADKEAIRVVLGNWFRALLEKSPSEDDALKAAATLSLFVDTLPPVRPENKLVLDIFKAHRIYNS